MTAPANALTGPARSAPARIGVRAAWAALAVVALTALALAAGRTPDAPTDAARAATLKEHTLCPVCDGQSVMESNAPVAAAIRTQIDQLVDEGYTDDEVRAHLADRFGDDVNALPPSGGFGALVWIVPVAAAVVAAAVLGATSLKWRRREAQTSEQPADAGARITLDLIDQSADAAARTWSTPRKVLALAGVAAMAIGGGVAVAAAVGLARPGDTITGDVDRSARSLTFTAEQLFNSGDYDGARATLNEALAIARDDKAALLLSAALYEQQALTPASGDAADPVGAITSALGELQRVLSANPLDVDALTVRGRLLVRLGDAELAALGIRSLDLAIDQQPASFEPWLWRGWAAREIEGDAALAIEMYEQALLRSPPPQMAEVLTQRIADLSIH